MPLRNRSAIPHRRYEVFWISAPDWSKIYYVSPTYSELWGEEAEKLYQQPFLWIDSIIEEDKEKIRSCIPETISKDIKEIIFPDYRIKKSDGAIIWVSARAFPIFDSEGNPHRIAGIAEDITERKRAEEAHRESELKYRSLIESSSDAIFAVDEHGRYQFANQIFASTLGHPAEHLVGKTFRDVYPKEHADYRFAATTRVFRTGQSESLEVEVPLPTGSLFFYATANPIRDDTGKVEMVLTHATDITQRKRAEEEKAKLEAQLQQAQKMESVGRLAGGMAHDFNNMLGVILGQTELELELEQVDTGQPIHADLTEIHMAATRSAGLTRQLLAFAREQIVTPMVLDLNETVDRMLTMLRRLIGEDIALHWQPAADLWLVKVDPSQIDQILTNLLVNARDAITGVGKVTLQTGNTTVDEGYCTDHPGFVPGEYVRLVASDDGCGMDKDTQAHLFEPFFTTKEQGKGTGLGLATVYGIVKQNDGFIDVYSEPGHGTTFSVYLPRPVGKAEQAPLDGPANATARGHETILLVEDESAILKLTTTILEQQGYTVLVAHTPGEAIRLATEHAGQIQLLITDVIMPEMNGRDLARSLLPLYPHLRRLFMSGYSADVIAHHGVLDAGVSFLQKPFSIKELAAKVRATLDRK